MLQVASDLLRKKNSLYGEGVWCYCIDILLFDGTEVPVTSDGNPVIWSGRQYIPFEFELDVIGGERRGELPNSVLRVSNITGDLQPYLEKGHGGVGSEVTIHVVNTEAPNLPSAGSYQFLCTGCKSTSRWVTFTLGAPSLLRKAFPRNMIRRNQCTWRYRGIECGYTGPMVACDKTLASCKARLNSSFIGCFPGAGRGGDVI